MDRLRTLLLSRARTVVLDPDRVASAATRPSRDVDVERFEDELAQLGFVMSLDLAMTVRRLPHQAIQDLKQWIIATLAASLATRPQVPLYRDLSDTDGRAVYLRRMLSWLSTRADQPCPWCGQVKRVNALDPCGHLVCNSCWALGSFAGCPICHRRIAVVPFVAPTGASDRVTHHDGQLRVIDLAFDAIEVARVRFERMLAGATPLSTADREEVETVIDVIGPRAAIWMPRRTEISIKETMAIAVARLWLVAPDRASMVKATQGHLQTATDVLRVAVVLMGGNPALVEPFKLSSIPRGLRRAVLSALDRLPPEQLLEDVTRRPGLWKRVGERLHPFEVATRFPSVALAFAALRGSNLRELTFADELRSRVAALDDVATGRAITTPITGRERVVVKRWRRPVEEALRARDVKTAIAHLARRPAELLRRVDHVLRIAGDDTTAIRAIVDAVRAAVPHGAPAILLTLASHVRARAARWPRRVYGPPIWATTDTRAPLRSDAIDAIADATRGELLARAGKRKHFARAVIDRALVDVRPDGKPDAPIGRPTLWDLVAIHTAARVNVIYVRERDGTIGTLRRRDDETPLQRLARLYDNPFADSVLSQIPTADAPTWVALVTGDVVLPKGSAGFVLDHRSEGPTAGTELRGSATDLLAELAAKP
jgi:hypothetical protein